MRRKAGVVVPAVIVCFTLFWGSLSSARAGTGFQPLLAEVPGKGAVDHLVTSKFLAHIAVGLKVTAALFVVLVVVAVTMRAEGGPSTGRATMTPEEAGRIAHAEFDH
jgi:hypothetical protein